MRRRAAQYMNEIVSLTVMLLLSVALVAGEAAETPNEISKGPQSGAFTINVGISFRHDGE